MSDVEVVASTARRHQIYGWWALVLFLSTGSLLEGLLGLKASFYMDPANVLRRELWTLAHAHGTLLAILNLVFAATLPRLGLSSRNLRLASHLLLDGALLLPLGFFAGGAFATEHDPWIGVLLVPLGAACLIAATLIVAVSVTRSPRP